MGKLLDLYYPLLYGQMFINFTSPITVSEADSFFRSISNSVVDCYVRAITLKWSQKEFEVRESYEI